LEVVEQPTVTEQRKFYYEKRAWAVRFLRSATSEKKYWSDLNKYKSYFHNMTYNWYWLLGMERYSHL